MKIKITSMHANSFAPLLCIATCLINAANEPLTMIFAHGLADTHRQAYLWQKPNQEERPYLHDGHVVAQDFPDATQHLWRVNFPWTSLGQENEIAALKETVDTFQLEHPGKKIILAGLSRGAATVINYLALHQPKNIAAVILESPFSSMRDVAQNLIASSSLHAIPYAYEISPYLVGCIFWQYSDSGIHPIDTVRKIDADIPVMFISKEDDSLVPTQLTQKLVDALQSSGHTKIHHLMLTQGKHGKYILGEEGEKMQRVVQAFFNCYGLPCDATCAAAGAHEFALT